MAKGRRFLISSAGAIAGMAAGRVLVRRVRGRATVASDDFLGSVRGTPTAVRGPLGSRIYAETFEAAPEPKGRTNGNGNGTAPGGTLVFTHGWCVSEAIWHYQKESLGTGPGALSMVTWDLPGHGHSSSLPPGKLTLERGIESLARVVDQTTDGPVVLVGHSLGGVLSLGYVLANPDTARRKVRGLVLAATPLVHQARAAAGGWLGSALEARVVGQVMQMGVQNSVVDRWFTREVGSSDQHAMSYRLIRVGFGPAPSPSHVRFVRDMAAAVPPPVRADTFRAMSGFDHRPRLGEVTVPVVLAIGGRDRLVSAAESIALAPAFPRAEVEEFPEAGHALFLEQHVRFNEVVRRFAARRLRADHRTRPEPARRTASPRSRA
jgi:pimeloyl-ACP methyl ester carboxylesterase